MLTDPALAAVLDTARDGVLLLRARGAAAPEIAGTNRRLEELLGYAGRELIGRSVRVLRPAGALREGFVRLQDACARGRPFEGQVALRTAAGGAEQLYARGEKAASSDLYVLWLQALPRGQLAAPEWTLPAEVLARLSREWWYALAVGEDGGLRPDFVDARLLAQLGLAPEQAGELFSRLLDQDRPAVRKRNQRLLRGEAARIRYRLVAADGQPVEVEDECCPLLDEEGFLTRVVGVMRRADEARAWEERTSGSCAAVVARLLHRLTLVIREDGVLVWASSEPATPLTERFFGLVGQDLAVALPAELADRWLELVDQALLAGEVRRQQGALPFPEAEGLFEVMAAPMNGRFALLLLRPVEPQAEREEAELASGLAEAPGAFAPAASGLPARREGPESGWAMAVLAAVADGVVATDRRGLVRWLNEAAQVIFGYEAEDLVGRPFHLLLALPAEQRIDFDTLSAQLEREPVGYMEVSGRRRDGEVIPLEICIAPIDVPPGGYTITIRDITVRRQTEEAIRALAYYDPLTALPNRLLFVDRLGEAIERARRNRQIFAVMLVDLDRFKLINDSLGLQIGDAMLRAVGERLRRTLRKSDTVARLGGDEFMILLHGVASAEAAARVAQKLLESLKPPFVVNGHELTTSACIGIAMFPHDGTDADALIKNADTALTRAKEQGRNHYQFYTTDMNAAAFERLMLESRLRRALAQQEFVVYYQPQVELESGRIVGVEALLRWFHPDHGMVPPSEFIPLAEETGLIVPIGEWVLETALGQVREWHRQGVPGLRLGVNLSARQFQQRDLVARIEELTARLEFPRALLELELTESVVMREAAENVRRLRELTQLGVQLTLDDFGTGYSSLGYLRRFPIHALKIDRSFIHDIAHEQQAAALVQAIVALGLSLKLRVVAEGVETREQLRLLRGFGCTEIQGYLFCRPLPAEELALWLREDRRLDLDGL